MSISQNSVLIVYQGVLVFFLDLIGELLDIRYLLGLAIYAVGDWTAILHTLCLWPIGALNVLD